MDYQSMSNEELEQYIVNKDGGAICEMAERCLTGSKEAEQNYTRAYQLYHKGEKMGLMEAYLGLASMYEQGIGLVRNQKLADIYYNMAAEDATTIVKQPLPTEIVTINQLAEELNKIEETKEEKNYSEARKMLQQFFDLLQEIQSGRKSADAGIDVDVWRVNAYWIMGHISYLEGDYPNSEHAFSQRGVLDMYPWAAYLIATMHKIQKRNSASDLENDMALLLTAETNSQLSGIERGDVLSMIGDLYLFGAGIQYGDSYTMAYSYYSQAKELGNYYAEIQMEKFRSMPSGEIQYIEE